MSQSLFFSGGHSDMNFSPELLLDKKLKIQTFAFQAITCVAPVLRHHTLSRRVASLRRFRSPHEQSTPNITVVWSKCQRSLIPGIPFPFQTCPKMSNVAAFSTPWKATKATSRPFVCPTIPRRIQVETIRYRLWTI